MRKKIQRTLTPVDAIGKLICDKENERIGWGDSERAQDVKGYQLTGYRKGGITAVVR
jgi:hypothetical protein